MGKMELNNLRDLTLVEQSELIAGTTANCNCDVTCTCDKPEAQQNANDTAKAIGEGVKQRLEGGK